MIDPFDNSDTHDATRENSRRIEDREKIMQPPDEEFREGRRWERERGFPKGVHLQLRNVAEL